MKKEHLSAEQEKKVEPLHWQVQEWKTRFQNLDEQLEFTSQLLDSYIFQTDIPGFSESLEDFKARLKSIEAIKKEVRDRISKHESSLGTMLEASDSTDNRPHYRRHDSLQAMVYVCLKDFQDLKAEIFKCAGDILKRRRPKGA